MRGNTFFNRLRFSLAVFLGIFLMQSAFAQSYKVLVFSKTVGFRHGESIAAGIPMFQSLAATNGFTVDFTENASLFTDANLAQYKAVVFLCTTGDVLDTAQQDAFQRYIRAGGGYVGVHSASDTEHTWAWYGQLVGAYFVGHPTGTPQATIKVADRFHPSTASLPMRWVRTDEWYNFNANPRGKVHVLATLDTKSYSGSTMGFDHPIAWCQEFEGGRAWYTGGGHTSASYSEPLFRAHVLGGVQWAAGVKAGEAGGTVNSNYQIRRLATNLSQPMELTVLPDGRVLLVEREGKVLIYKPDTSATLVAAQLTVFSGVEDGLLGVTQDPDFSENNWVYMMYSPPSPDIQRVSRFTMAGDTLVLASEKVLLEFPVRRDICCHSGGSLTFDPDGNLYISTGDNTYPLPLGTDKYAPTDERPGNSGNDVQKSSANANDLRGKILRIHPETNGTYSIPDGNLFPPGSAANTRPEIYVMGCRNPFRISVDSKTGWLYWGDVGPDAYSSDANRGPAGHDELNQTRSAGNYGWPYFIADNKAYREFDFATLTPGAYYDANSPTNNSPNNTGPQVLPPAKPALLWYPYGTSAEFPELGSDFSRTALAGPMYHFDTNIVSNIKLPKYFDNTLFFYDLSRHYIKEIKFDTNGAVLKINPFVPHISFNHIIDMELGHDGALYILERDGFRLSRIEYVGGNYSPVAVASGTPDSGSTPLTVQFSSAGTHDPNATEALTLKWSFLGDGVINSTNANPTYTYLNPGSYNAQLTVTDPKGNISIANVPIVVGNNRPVVTIQAPPNGAFVDWNNYVTFQVKAQDAEDGSTTNGTLSCSSVLFEHFLGHNEHEHSEGMFNACDGLFRAPSFGHEEYGNFFVRMIARHTDAGAPGSVPLTGTTTHILHPTRKQAEYYSRNNGITVQATLDPNGGYQEVIGISNGDWISFNPMNLSNITNLTLRAYVSVTSSIEVRAGSPAGTLAGTITLQPTGSYADYSGAITNPGGSHEYFFVFKSNQASASLFQLNWMEFRGRGVNLPVFLQSAVSVNEGFADELGAVVNYSSRTITIPINNTARFYRLRSARGFTLKNFQVVGTNFVVGFE